MNINNKVSSNRHELILPSDCFSSTVDLAIGLKVKQIGLKLAHKHQMSPKICFRCLRKKRTAKRLVMVANNGHQYLLVDY